MSSLISPHSQPQCLLSSLVSHELFIAAEIRNYVKEAAHKSLWLGIVNQSIPREGDTATLYAVGTSSQSYFFVFADHCASVRPFITMKRWGKETCRSHVTFHVEIHKQT